MNKFYTKHIQHIPRFIRPKGTNSIINIHYIRSVKIKPPVDVWDTYKVRVNYIPGLRIFDEWDFQTEKDAIALVDDIYYQIDADPIK